MTWIDASDYFAVVEARQEPCTLTRDDMVILALIDPGRVPGYCCSCGADIRHKATQARWCDDCIAIKTLLDAQRSLYHWRNGTHGQTQCVDCGEFFKTRKGPGRRCNICQPIHTQEIKNEWDRNRRRKLREARA